MTKEEEIRQLEYNMQRQLMQEQAVMSAMQKEQGSSYSEGLKEFAEYVREFSRDKPIKVNEGKYEDGTVPEHNLIKYWAVHSPNFVFSNFNDKGDIKKIQLMEMQLDLADSMYNLNFSAIDRLPEEMRTRVRDSLVKEKQSVLDGVNQREHTFARFKRGLNGKERELMVTKSLVAGTTGSNQEQRKKGLLQNFVGGFLSKG